jgi:hypothetical protein
MAASIVEEGKSLKNLGIKKETARECEEKKKIFAMCVESIRCAATDVPQD